MNKLTNDQFDYFQPMEIAEGVYWVGFADPKAGLHCNPYLIVDGDEAVLIDSGSRDEFSTVMLKILRTGIDPSKIKRLIYQHFDPDLCGNIPQFEAIINDGSLKIISHRENNIFINYYSSKSPKLCIETLDYEYKFTSGRVLKFIRTPYSHCPGSFITYDCKTKTLFTSDIFGSYDAKWSLFRPLNIECHECEPERHCVIYNKECRLYGIIKFHELIMNSSKALRYALDEIEKLDINLIAPQHGSLIDTEVDFITIMNQLRSLENIGFDNFIKGESK